MSLSLDTSGSQVANYVQAESQNITPGSLGNFGLIYLQNGPFFGKNCVVKFTPTGGGAETTLVKGTDYFFNLRFPGFGIDDDSSVWGALVLKDRTLNGSLKVAYQGLGGQWTFNTTQINNYLNSNVLDQSRQYVGLVANPTFYLPSDLVDPFVINSPSSVVQAQGTVQANGPVSLGVAYMDKNTTQAPSYSVSRTGKVTVLTSNTTGASQNGATSVEFVNLSTSITFTVNGTTIPLEYGSRPLRFEGRGNDTLAPISYSIPNGGKVLMTQVY